MKIANLEISGVLGVKHIIISTPAPITVIAGPNGSGKSSIAESIRMAFGASPERVRLKSEHKELINEHIDAKKAFSALNVDGKDIMFTLPKGETDSDFSENWTLPYVLDHRLFSSLKPDEIRSFLFRLSGAKLSRDYVKSELVAAGADEAKADQAVIHLRGGFPAAVEFADSQLKEARGAWRAITGEVYGTQKAEEWQAEAVENVPTDADVQAAHDAYKNAKAEHEAEQASVAALRAKADAWAAYQKKHVPLEEREKLLARAQTKLDIDRAD